MRVTASRLRSRARPPMRPPIRIEGGRNPVRPCLAPLEHSPGGTGIVSGPPQDGWNWVGRESRLETQLVNWVDHALLWSGSLCGAAS